MSEPETEARLVDCIKLGERLPGLSRAPFPNEVGQFIYEHLSHRAWLEWLEESIRYINTRGLDLSKPEDAEFLLGQLKIWMGVEDGELMKTAWTPPQQ